jgi:glycosyltransferase involved in cell wall biosynthesis
VTQRRSPRAFAPIRLLELELADSRAAAGTCSEGVPRYGRARVLIRLHGAPLGVLDVGVEEGRIVPAAIAGRASHELRDAIDAHLADETSCAAGQRRFTLDRPEVPPCERARDAFRATAPPATVVIATCKQRARLAATLESVLALDYPRYEVVVVDNDPTPASRELVETSYGDRSNLLYVHEPVPGLAVAHNRGLREAGGDIVAFTDDDVIVDRRWLLELACAFFWAEGVACVTGLILPAELETPAQIWLDERVRLNKGYKPILFDPRANHPGGGLLPYAAGAFGSGANMAFRTDALRALGGFDPATGAGTWSRGGDDLAAFFGIVANGGSVAYQPSAIVRHFYRRDLDALRRQMFDYGAGLGAYLTKIVVDRPTILSELGRHVPAGVTHALHMRSGGVGKDSFGFEAELARVERRGMLAGPPAYLLERLRRRSLYARAEPRGTVAAAA